MVDSLIIRFSGEQGQGVQSVAVITGQFFAALGYRVLAVNDYASRIAGGYSYSQIRVCTGPARSVTLGADLSFAISARQVGHDLKTLKSGAVLFADQAKVPEMNRSAVVDVPLSELLEAKERRGINIFYVGMLLALTGQSLDDLAKLLERRFGKQGAEVVSANVRTAQKGYDYALPMSKLHRQLDPADGVPAAVLKTGSQAIALGAIAAGVTFHAGYPMAPSTAVMNTLAGLSKQCGVLVEQAEDEIAAINLAIGASYAGARAMTATSGGGLSLMSESVSLAGVSENPLVIVNVQRPGPATGLPTKTAQGDLKMVQYLGHGEFTRAILTPGNAAEAFDAAQKAFYLADKYQIPVFILSDQHLGDSLWSSPPWKVRPEYQQRFLKLESSLEEPALYPRYSLERGCVSPRAIPGLTNDLVLADSHTHDENGHITEEPDTAAAMVRKLVEKRGLVASDMTLPEQYETEDAGTILVSFGSSRGVVRDSCEALRAKGIAVGHVHFSEVYPLPRSAVRKAMGAARLITIEANATGQFAQLLRGEYGVAVNEQVLKYNGRPFYVDELTEELRGRLLP
jgi:2-oxoglutarate/2-oxoacid ferredoxin oxidoreductase subunit alpha